MSAHSRLPDGRFVGRDKSRMLYVLGAGSSSGLIAVPQIAAGVVASESLVFAAHGFRCPLTQVTECHRRRARLGHRHLRPALVAWWRATEIANAWPACCRPG
jgi:hypothetical protein